MTNASIFRMIISMREQGETSILHRPNKRTMRAVTSRRIGVAVSVLLVGMALLSCASSYKYPAASPPVTTILPAGYDEAFMAALSTLKDDVRLVLHVIDKDGRFVAWEKTGGFIFFQRRTVLDIRLEPVSSDETKLTLQLSAEDYQLGGLTRPSGWYPSSDIDTFLGEDIVGLIEKNVAG